MDLTASFSEWLRRQRKARDLTQLDLAEALGCSESAIRKLELGERRPSRQIADLLADFFRVPGEERDAFLRFARGRDLTEYRPGSAGAAGGGGDGGDGRTVSSGNSNLPAQLTPFVGRQEEVASVKSLLSHEHVRLLTLTGPPGIGKTRLALQVASELANEPAQGLFEHGVFFVPLAPITEPELVLVTIAQALGVKDVGGRPVLASLIQFLQGKYALLVLDNFEQVVSSAPALSDLLNACQHLKALVTSREVLHVRGEQQFPVPPLALPDEVDLPGVADLQTYPAILLFVQRARAVKPGFTLTDDNAEAVADVCAHVDGLPLAIELAAARTNLLTAEEIRVRLRGPSRDPAKEGRESRFKLLTGGARDLPPRHQTLRGAIDWSYNLLSEGEQTLFARLSVFVGGCTLSAAEAVCNSMGDLPFDAPDGLSSLIEKSLLKREEALGESRYTMLEMILEYASEKLETIGEAEVIRRQHAEYYLSLSEAARQQVSGAEQFVWLDRLERDHDNLRAALEWSRAQASSAEISLRLAASLALFWEFRGNFTEVRQRLAAALSGPGADELTNLRAEVLGLASVTAFHQGDYRSMPPLDRERLELHRRAGDKRGMASALTQLARAAVAMGDYTRAHSLLEQALALRREVGIMSGISHALAEMGALARCEGDYVMARTAYEESLALARESGEKVHIAWQLLNLGHVVHHERAYKKANRLFAEGLALFQQVREPRGIANCLYGLAGVAGSQGLAQKAAQLFGSAKAILYSTGSGLEPADQMEYERSLVATKSKVDPAAWQASWSRGEAMRVEEAIAYALEVG